MPPEVEQVDEDGNQQGQQAPKHIRIKETPGLTKRIMRTTSKAEMTTSAALEPTAVSREGSARVVGTFLQRDGNAEGGFDATRQTASSNMVCVDVDRFGTTFLFHLGIGVQKAMMIAGAQLHHHAHHADVETAAEAQTAKHSSMDQAHVGITHVDGLVHVDMYSAYHMDFSEQTHATFCTSNQIGLEIGRYGQAQLERQAQVGIAHIHRVMHQGTRDMLVFDVGAALHIHGFWRDNQGATDRYLNKKTAHWSKIPILVKLAQGFVAQIGHLWHVHASLDANAYRLFLIIISAHLSHRNCA